MCWMALVSFDFYYLLTAIHLGMSFAFRDPPKLAGNLVVSFQYQAKKVPHKKRDPEIPQGVPRPFGALSWLAGEAFSDGSHPQSMSMFRLDGLFVLHVVFLFVLFVCVCLFVCA